MKPAKLAPAPAPAAAPQPAPEAAQMDEKKPRPKRTRPIEDEWGLFDPEQAGMKATLRAMSGPSVAVADVRAVAPSPPAEFEKPNVEPTFSEPAAGRPQNGAVYALEYPTQCPHCETSIWTLRVFRLLRTQVSFTSTLPRKGYVMVCPECDRVLSAELSGMI